MTSSLARGLRWMALPLLMGLAGCAPHPAAGVWVAQGEGETPFSRIEVTYEGRADLYAPGEEQAGRHCFWGGTGERSISLTCKPAFDTSIEEEYRLTVTEAGEAQLSRDGMVVTRFSRQPQ